MHLLAIGAIDWKMRWSVTGVASDTVGHAPANPDRGAEYFTGPGDDGSFDTTHPFPNADLDMPGDRAAAMGGGATGGTDTYTGRSTDDADLRTEVWNSDDHYRRPRTRTGSQVASDESINRDHSRDFGDRTDSRPQARDGGEQGRAGTDGDDGLGHGGVVAEDRNWDDADPMFDGNPGAHEVQRRSGSTTPTKQRAMVDDGDAANEAPRRGERSDRVSSAAASNETDPMPMEFTRNRSGGDADGSGVAGDRFGDGVSGRSAHTSGDTASTSADADRGSGRISVSAERQNPYFRKMYSQLDKAIAFPRELALSLDQGEVIVMFSLATDGRVGSVRVTLPSGFEQFDSAVVAAVKSAGPFGKVPESVSKGKESIVVRLPYAFRNRMIR